MPANSPIGVFDSGYGGLTILKELIRTLPEYDFIYLGDNARNPYGPRSFRVVYEYTLEAVKYLFRAGCPLVVLACNTASAKALRNIQQLDLPLIAPERRVLGVIRPCVERVSEITCNGHVGVLGTIGTVVSESYPIELEKWSDGKVIRTVQEACPMWVPIVENNEIGTPGAEYFVEKNILNLLQKDPSIDTVILACTHYPLMMDSIRKYVPDHVNILEQGNLVAEKLKNYLERHPEIENRITRNKSIRFLTTETAENFEGNAAKFIGFPVKAESIHL